jgi:hypothetical protein
MENQRKPYKKLRNSMFLFGMRAAMAALVVFFIYHENAHAASVTIDPDLGWSGYFAWIDGLGQIDDISLVEYDYDYVETEWSITLPTAGYMTMVTAYDGYVVGDEFDLYVDGGHAPWTQEYYDSSGYYHGEYDNLFLSAGTHSITLYVTALAYGYNSGAGMANFSRVVPEPTTIVLLGLGGLAVIRRRRKYIESF